VCVCVCVCVCVRAHARAGLPEIWHPTHIAELLRYCSCHMTPKVFRKMAASGRSPDVEHIYMYILSCSYASAPDDATRLQMMRDYNAKAQQLLAELGLPDVE